MQSIFGRTSKLLMAVFQYIVIHIHVIRNINTGCDEYLKFSLYTYKPNQYMDVVFRLHDAPDYVLELYHLIENQNKISLSDNSLQYIIQGPCLDTGEVFRIASMFCNDYHAVLNRKYEFVYDLDVSLELSEKMLKPIYDELKK